MDGIVNIGVTVDWLSGGSCIMVDNIRLVRMPDDYVEPGDPTEDEIQSVTEGIINGDFVDEATMQADLLQMLANISQERLPAGTGTKQRWRGLRMLQEQLYDAEQ